MTMGSVRLRRNKSIRFTIFTSLISKGSSAILQFISLPLAAQVLDRVREGYMEAGIVNAWGTAGNFVGAIVILTGVRYEPSVSFLLLAVFGPNILARLASMVFLVKKRPWLIQQRDLPKRETMTGLISEGLSFTATSFLVYLVNYTICALIVGRVAGPSDVAIFHVLMSITTAFTGILIMVGRPMWAEIVDLMETKDHQ